MRFRFCFLFRFRVFIFADFNRRHIALGDIVTGNVLISKLSLIGLKQTRRIFFLHIDDNAGGELKAVNLSIFNNADTFHTGADFAAHAAMGDNHRRIAFVLFGLLFLLPFTFHRRFNARQIIDMIADNHNPCSQSGNAARLILLGRQHFLHKFGNLI